MVELLALVDWIPLSIELNTLVNWIQILLSIDQILLSTKLNTPVD